ncbi:MAG: hypothetical protein A3J51_04305 [Omnitrophica WOR_2 bacterium RIFCSPHIGHO2_02_FULL_45_21]|nr:MAG: hypothetical protein A3J51_04305 [Omnitrophica WOR_2 bacterium RIFCSPHIGHO2_02_FULL_45_21]
MEELDLRAVAENERHPDKIMNAWKELARGDVLRIINDHDPKPLRYMFQIEFKHTFAWEYKRQGPDEWIVEIKKIKPPAPLSPEQKKKRDELKQILKKLHQASPEELGGVKKEAEKYFKEVEPKELAMAEQELIQEGTTRSEMKRLCDVHLEVIKAHLGAASQRLKLPASHPLTICKDEHKIIKRNLKRLGRILEKLKAAGSFDKVKKEIDTLKELSHFFLETEKHHQREEKALFPRLEAHGIVEPPQIFKEDHLEFMAKKKTLNEIAMAQDKKDFRKFVELLSPVIEFLTKNLEEHIYKEDNILYPMAYETLEKEEWLEVRKKFDAIGYCCFAPADLEKKKGKKKRK